MLLALVIAAGVYARVAWIEQSTIEHFDEGVYASNLWFGAESGYAYPLRYFYAPPLLPALIEWSMILSGQITGRIALLPSLVAGCATVPVMWWIGRSWFGPPAGIAAAVLAAFSEVHVLLSRAALTDALLLLLVALAIFLLERAWRRGSLAGFVAGGFVVGLAWWTKYNGWLPLAISLVSLAAAGVVRAIPRHAVWRGARGWGVACATAVLVWSPVWYSLQPHGGYSAVAANHSRYVVGLSGWPASASRQMANLQAVDGAGGAVGWCLAVLAAWLLHIATACGGSVRGPSIARECVLVGGLSLFAAALAGWLGGSVACLILGTAGLLAAPIRKRRANGTTGLRLSLSYWQLAAWFVLLAVLTPLYTPYLRLTLPLLGATWLAGGLFAGAVLQRIGQLDSMHAPAHPRYWALQAAGTSAAVIALLGLTSWALGVKPPAVWQSDRRGLERIASQIRQRVSVDGPAPSDGQGAPGEADSTSVQQVVYVYGEPALLFHLRAAGLPAVFPVGTAQLTAAQSATGKLPTYLAAGLHASSDPAFHESFSQMQDRMELVGEFEYAPSLLVQQDQHDPRERPEADRTAVRLYRLKD